MKHYFFGAGAAALQIINAPHVIAGRCIVDNLRDEHLKNTKLSYKVIQFFRGFIAVVIG
jgi:hypothetical protein